MEPGDEDQQRLVGTIRGPLEGLGAGLECWCGPLIGWRSFGDLLLGGGQSVVVRHRGRLSVGLTWDLGEAPPMRRPSHDPEDDE